MFLMSNYCFSSFYYCFPEKTVSITKGFYIAGGSPFKEVVKSLRACKDLCSLIPHCFAADFYKEAQTCFMHTFQTACNTLKAHPGIVHFKKVPCCKSTMKNKGWWWSWIPKGCAWRGSWGWGLSWIRGERTQLLQLSL